MKRKIVAYEFFNPSTGHAIVDYTEHTHVGQLTPEKGYIKRELVYAMDLKETCAEIRRALDNMDLS